MARGRGRGKPRGGRGGGRRQYVTSLEDMEARDVREQAYRARKASGEEDEEEEDEDSDDRGNEDSDGDPTMGMSLLEIKEKETAEKVAKPKGVQGLIEVENPNAKKAHQKMGKVKDMDVDAAPVELSRREREALEAERKKAHYMKLHAEGKTDEAKADLARLAEVRKRREEAAKKKKDEEEAAKAREKNGDSGAADASGGGEDLKKLNPIEVKKMNPTKLKELLKERDLSTQGSKKDLTDRLLAWNKA